MTGRSIEERLREHLNKSIHGSNTRLARAMRSRADLSQWNIEPLYKTPIYPDALDYERNCIAYLTMQNKSILLNTAVNLEDDHLLPFNSQLNTIVSRYEYEVHPEYSDVYVYRKEGEMYWTIGHRGRSIHDSSRKWQSYTTEYCMKHDAIHYAYQLLEFHFDDAELEDPNYVGHSDVTCNVSMSEQQNYLTIFNEELTELTIELLSLQQTVSKAMRFGLNEAREGFNANHERIRDEWNDLLGSVIKLAEHGFDITPDMDKIAAKVEKIQHYTNHSKQLRIINDAH